MTILEIHEQLTKMSANILLSKNKTYQGMSTDGLANFKRLANRFEHISLDPQDVLLVLMEKHIDVIRQGSYGSDLDDLQERICDVINYLVLLYGLEVERILEGDDE